MVRFSEWLKMENAKRLSEGKSIIEPFYPHDYLKSQSSDFAHFVFLKADEADINHLVEHPQNKDCAVRLRHYRDTDGSKATVSDNMMQKFLEACLEYRDQLEITPSISSIESMDKVKIKSGPFAGCEATVQRVQQSHGTIHLQLTIQLLAGVMNIRMDNVDKRNITILNREAADDIRTDFIEYTQNHLLEILSHRVKRIDDTTINRRDADMLVRLYRYRYHHIKNESARYHFLALMLICAHLCRYENDEIQLREQVLHVLEDMNRKSESKAATDTRTYLWIALYISTHNPVYRNAAKQYVREHQPKSAKLRQFVALIREGRKV